MSLRFRLFLSLFATLTPVLRAQTAAVPAGSPEAGGAPDGTTFRARAHLCRERGAR